MTEDASPSRGCLWGPVSWIAGIWVLPGQAEYRNSANSLSRRRTGSKTAASGSEDEPHAFLCLLQGSFRYGTDASVEGRFVDSSLRSEWTEKRLDVAAQPIDFSAPHWPQTSGREPLSNFPRRLRCARRPLRSCRRPRDGRVRRRARIRRRFPRMNRSRAALPRSPGVGRHGYGRGSSSRSGNHLRQTSP